MNIRYIDNACCIYESEGFQLLADPWLSDGAFEGSWYHPTGSINITDEELQAVDALYISHVHPDHFDPVTLRKFRKDIPILVLDKGPNFLHKKLEDLEFTNLIKVKDGENVNLGPFQITMYGPFDLHPFDDSVLGNLLDSAIVLRDEIDVVLNANDNAPTLEAAKKLHERHGDFTVAQIKRAIAGAYPSCFMNLFHEEKLQKKEWLLGRLKERSEELGKILHAREVKSFAGSYCLAGSLAWKNEYIAVDGLDLTKVPEGSPYPYELDSEVTEAEYIQLLTQCIKARENLWDKQKKFNFFPNYKVSIALGESGWFSFNFNKLFPVTKEMANLVCWMDPRLLRRVLNKKSHWNNAEIGCHIDFYRVPDIYNPDISTMMSFFHC